MPSRTPRRAFVNPDARARAATERRAVDAADRGAPARRRRRRRARPRCRLITLAGPTLTPHPTTARPTDVPTATPAVRSRHPSQPRHRRRAVSVPFDGGALALTVASTEPHVRRTAASRPRSAHALGAPDRLAGADGVALPDAGASTSPAPSPIPSTYHPTATRRACPRRGPRRCRPSRPRRRPTRRSRARRRTDGPSSTSTSPPSWPT